MDILEMEICLQSCNLLEKSMDGATSRNLPPTKKMKGGSGGLRDELKQCCVGG